MSPRRVRPGFGRLIAPDARDKDYSMRSLLRGVAESGAPSSRLWSLPNKYQLDQGDTPTCVGHGCAHFLAAAPHQHPVVEDTALTIYNLAQRLDEWPGENYEGTSVRGGMKALQNLGFISEYRWAFTEDVLWRYVLARGPAVIGVTWLTGMMALDRKGYVNLTGGEEGGHCVALIGADEKRQAYRGMNSWDTFGRFWLRREDMRVLLEELGGEAASALEVAKP